MDLASIDALIDGVIGREGAYSNHPADRGGATRWGVTEQVARAYGYAGEMTVLPRDVAVSIYRKQYWLDPGFSRVGCIYPDVAVLLFDIGVNMGTGVAATFLQRVLNSFNGNGQHYADLVADGRLGALSYQALSQFEHRRGAEGGDRLYEAVRDLRGARYIELGEARPANEAFTYGWFGRVLELAKSLRR